jgi:hypothetical protein
MNEIVAVTPDSANALMILSPGSRTNSEKFEPGASTERMAPDRLLVMLFCSMLMVIVSPDDRV